MSRSLLPALAEVTALFVTQFYDGRTAGPKLWVGFDRCVRVRDIPENLAHAHVLTPIVAKGPVLSSKYFVCGTAM